jgi:hypothetical protein
MVVTAATFLIPVDEQSPQSLMQSSCQAKPPCRPCDGSRFRTLLPHMCQELLIDAINVCMSPDAGKVPMQECTTAHGTSLLLPLIPSLPEGLPPVSAPDEWTRAWAANRVARP